jgi:NAD(P)-dependent dehydrogenase (short-subunit alcohol dehydrogenase family)/DNA-binding MarR family transcriptional regulator
LQLEVQIGKGKELTMQDNRVALVTGANQGVGLQVAKELAANGLTVLVGSRNSERGEAAAKEIGPGAVALQLDVTDGDSIATAAERIRQETGRLDLLVNNAGISKTTPGGLRHPSNASLDEIRAVWEVNVFGVVAVYQAMLPLLRESPDARIVNVSSGVGSLTTNADPAYPYHAHFDPIYPASKTALNAMTLAMMIELESTGIKVNRVSGLHQDEPQRIRGHGVGRGRLPGSGARCTARPGRSDRHVHAVGKRDDPVVTGSPPIHEHSPHGSAGAWAKKYYFAVRAAMESVLRPYDLGSTQFYVLYQLANHGPTMQRDLTRMLQIERATLSGIVTTLVRKGLIDQMPGSEDQRQRVLRLTGAGMKLWEELPDPLALIRAIAFDGADEAELATAIRVLQSATQRLNDHMAEAADGAPRSLGLPPTLLYPS